jgi:hypothetical protein
MASCPPALPKGRKRQKGRAATRLQKDLAVVILGAARGTARSMTNIRRRLGG